MRSANLFGPLKGLCPHKALIGLTQASGLAGGFDFLSRCTQLYFYSWVHTAKKIWGVQRGESSLAQGFQ